MKRYTAKVTDSAHQIRTDMAVSPDIRLHILGESTVSPPLGHLVANEGFTLSSGATVPQDVDVVVHDCRDGSFDAASLAGAPQRSHLWVFTDKGKTQAQKLDKSGFAVHILGGERADSLSTRIRMVFAMDSLRRDQPKIAFPAPWRELQLADEERWVTFQPNGHIESASTWFWTAIGTVQALSLYEFIAEDDRPSLRNAVVNLVAGQAAVSLD
ncbi:MAG TPA: hypothetical protein DCQ06_10065, partial [Myxococcales bacterium]|nr:hypothetical protein [Myxococcales bacterium]